MKHSSWSKVRGLKKVIEPKKKKTNNIQYKIGTSLHLNISVEPWAQLCNISNMNTTFSFNFG